MNNHELATVILDLIGGKDNVISAYNCMTRLRVTLVDPSKVKTEELKAVEGVLGIIEDEQYQIVVGPGKAKKVCDEFIQIADIDPSKPKMDTSKDWQDNKAAMKSGQKDKKWKTAIRNIADIFMPLIPAIIAAGIFNGFASLLSQTPSGSAQVAAASGFIYVTITVFQLIGGAFLGYFAIYTGINAATKFGATPALGGMIGAMSIMPQIVDLSKTFGLYNEATPLESILTTGKGGIIGVIVGVWLLSIIEKQLRKIIPDTLDLVLTPIFTLLITVVLFVFAIMPAAGFASDLLVTALNFLIVSTNPVVSIISGFVLSALFLPMVLLGLHHGLIPIYAIQLEALGGVTLFPVLAMAGAGQVGAALAIYFKARKVKNTRIQKIIYGALPAGFLGIGEPLIYGVTLPLGKPFITAGIGAGIGGAFVRLTNVMSVAWGPSGLVAIPLMSNPTAMLNFFIGLLISYGMGFLITFVIIKDNDVATV